MVNWFMHDGSAPVCVGCNAEEYEYVLQCKQEERILAFVREGYVGFSAYRVRQVTLFYVVASYMG